VGATPSGITEGTPNQIECYTLGATIMKRFSQNRRQTARVMFAIRSYSPSADESRRGIGHISSDSTVIHGLNRKPSGIWTGNQWYDPKMLRL